MGIDNDRRVRTVLDRVTDDGRIAEACAELQRGRELLARLEAQERQRYGDPNNAVWAPLAGGLDPYADDRDDLDRHAWDRFAEYRRHLKAVHGGATW